MSELAGLYGKQGRLEETAKSLEVSPRTVVGDWTFARAWLYRFLAEKGR